MSTRKQRAEIVGQYLDALYPEVDVPLHHRDPFTLLVAVVLSAQCTDKRVNLVTPALFAEADTPEKMVQIGPERIRTLIASCGLAVTKSNALFRLSQQLIERHGGIVPDTFSELEALAGVGHKTASVIMAQAFGIPAFPVDTHIHRLARRWRLSDGSSVRKTETDLKKLFPPERWNKLHIQMILYGREHCTARGCDGTRCTLCQTLFAPGS